MKDETTNSYELTLTPNYVSDWNFNDTRKTSETKREWK